MLTEETKKRVYIGLLIIAAVLGLLFVIFAVFINRGTLTIVAKAPYVLMISEFKTVACATNVCSNVIAPGTYTVTLKKQGYKDATKGITVPIGGEHKEEITLEFIPVVTELSAGQTIFTRPNFEKFKQQLPDTNLFFEDNYVIYLARNAETRRQTLYTRNIENENLGPETVATSFIRDLKEYQLVPAIDERNKIAVIDNTDNQSSLYMVDLKNKTRTKLFTYPLIKDLKWLPSSEDFLFEARDSGSLTESIFLYRTHNGEVQKFDLKTSLKNIGMIDKEHLIAATTQAIGATENLADLEGSLVVLSELEATPTVGFAEVNGVKPSLKFVEYSLVSLQSRLIKVEQNVSSSEEVKLSEDKKNLYFLADEKVYELRLRE